LHLEAFDLSHTAARLNLGIRDVAQAHLAVDEQLDVGPHRANRRGGCDIPKDPPVPLYHPRRSGTESKWITPGDQEVVTYWRSWQLGLSVCFDVRFPELYRELCARGAEVLTIPAAFVSFTGPDHWEVLLRARAIENQAYVLAPAQIGPYDGGSTYGRSCIIDPWGTMLAVVGDEDGTGIAVAELKHSRLDGVRTHLPVLASRRFARSSISQEPAATSHHR